MKTFMAKPDVLKRKWYVVDAAGKPLGRISTHIAGILKGKHKPEYTPYVDTGDYVIVLNAAKVLLTGNKPENKIYRHHSLYPGGMKQMKYKDFMKRHPERVIELSVRRMLPKNSLGRAMYKKLKVYRGSEHKQQAQQPEKLEFDI